MGKKLVKRFINPNATFFIFSVVNTRFNLAATVLNYNYPLM